MTPFVPIFEWANRATRLTGASCAASLARTLRQRSSFFARRRRLSRSLVSLSGAGDPPRGVGVPVAGAGERDGSRGRRWFDDMLEMLEYVRCLCDIGTGGARLAP